MGKADFKRYAESGQVMINRAMHLGELCYASSYSTTQSCQRSSRGVPVYMP